MEFIEDIGLVHRDLAARNVVLVEKPHTGILECKVTDFGLARDGGDEGELTSWLSAAPRARMGCAHHSACVGSSRAVRINRKPRYCQGKSSR